MQLLKTRFPQIRGNQSCNHHPTPSTSLKRLREDAKKQIKFCKKVPKNLLLLLAQHFQTCCIQKRDGMFQKDSKINNCSDCRFSIKVVFWDAPVEVTTKPKDAFVCIVQVAKEPKLQTFLWWSFLIWWLVALMLDLHPPREKYQKCPEIGNHQRTIKNFFAHFSVHISGEKHVQ